MSEQIEEQPMQSSLEEKKEERIDLMPTPAEQKILDQKQKEYYDHIGTTGNLDTDVDYMTTIMEGIDDPDKENIVAVLPEYDDEKNLLELLGLQDRFGDVPDSELDEEQLEFRVKVKKDKIENDLEAEKQIKVLEANLAEVEKITKAAEAKVEVTKQAIEDKKEEIVKQQGRGAIIEKSYEARLLAMRQKKVGEIHWIMVESKESDDNNEDKQDEYTKIIHNYLMLLFLEDNEKIWLKSDLAGRQKQIHEHFVKQFDKFIDPIRKLPHPGREFRKIFPRPRPKAEDEDRFAEMYEMYEEFVEENFNQESDEEIDVLGDSSVGDSEDQSSVNASNQGMTVLDNAQQEESVAIPEENEGGSTKEQ